MWGHDLGWWGFVLAIATLVLAYPIDVLAHLTSPIVKNWWAEGSISSLGRRIIALEKELEEIEKNPVISDGEERILRAMTWIGVIQTQMVGFFILIIGTFVTDRIRDKDNGWIVTLSMGLI